MAYLNSIIPQKYICLIVSIDMNRQDAVFMLVFLNSNPGTNKHRGTRYCFKHPFNRYVGGVEMDIEFYSK